MPMDYKKMIKKMFFVTALSGMFITHGMERPQGKEWTNSMLLESAKEGDLAGVKEALRSEADVNFCDEYKFTSLHWAAARGYGAVMRELLAYHANPNAPSIYQETPLHQACRTGTAESVKVLLNGRADLEARSNDGQTPLHLAVQNGDLQIIRVLLDRGADLYACSNAQETPLHIAAKHKGEIKKELVNWLLFKAVGLGDLEAVKRALRWGADVNGYRFNGEGETPLHLAAGAGHINVVRELLDRGADINARNNDKETPLHCAALYGRVEVVKELLQRGAEVNVHSFHEPMPIRHAPDIHHEGRVEFSLRRLAMLQNKHGKTPLHVAAYNGHETVVKELLNAGADVNARDAAQITPLHMARSVEVVAELLNRGADVNVHDISGHTPLHDAACRSRADIVKILLDKGGDMNVYSEGQRWTPFHCAVSCIEVIKELLMRASRGVRREVQISVIAEVLRFIGDILNKHKEKADCEICADRNKQELETVRSILEEFIRHNKTQPEQSALQPSSSSALQTLPCSILPALPVVEAEHESQEVAEKKSPAHREVKEKEGCSICAELYEDTTDEKVIVLPCAHKFHGECVNPWLRQNKGCPECRVRPETIDVDSLDNRLFVAVVRGKIDEIRQMLLHANINTENAGITPLMHAASKGRAEIVRLLLEHADINTVNKLKETLKIAVAYSIEHDGIGYDAILALLEQGAIIEPADDKAVGILGQALSRRPLLLAAIMGDIYRVRLLAKTCIEIDVLKEALVFAVAQGQVDVVNCLVDEFVKRGKKEFLQTVPLERAQIILGRTRSDEYQERYSHIIRILLGTLQDLQRLAISVPVRPFIGGSVL